MTEKSEPTEDRQQLYRLLKILLIGSVLYSVGAGAGLALATKHAAEKAGAANPGVVDSRE